MIAPFGLRFRPLVGSGLEEGLPGASDEALVAETEASLVVWEPSEGRLSEIFNDPQETGINQRDWQFAMEL